jgi:hypothetical protein
VSLLIGQDPDYILDVLRATGRNVKGGLEAVSSTIRDPAKAWKDSQALGHALATKEGRKAIGGHIKGWASKASQGDPDAVGAGLSSFIDPAHGAAKAAAASKAMLLTGTLLRKTGDEARQLAEAKALYGAGKTSDEVFKATGVYPFRHADSGQVEFYKQRDPVKLNEDVVDQVATTRKGSGNDDKYDWNHWVKDDDLTDRLVEHEQRNKLPKGMTRPPLVIDSHLPQVSGQTMGLHTSDGSAYGGRAANRILGAERVVVSGAPSKWAARDLLAHENQHVVTGTGEAVGINDVGASPGKGAGYEDLYDYVKNGGERISRGAGFFANLSPEERKLLSIPDLMELDMARFRDRYRAREPLTLARENDLRLWTSVAGAKNRGPVSPVVDRPQSPVVARRATADELADRIRRLRGGPR